MSHKIHKHENHHICFNHVKKQPPFVAVFFGAAPSRTLWLFNIAMENGPFIDDFPIKTSIYKVIFHGYGTNNQMVTPRRTPRS